MRYEAYQHIIFPKVDGVPLILRRGDSNRPITLKQAKDEIVSAVLRGESVGLGEENKLGASVFFYAKDAVQQAAVDLHDLEEKAGVSLTKDYDVLTFDSYPRCGPEEDIVMREGDGCCLVSDHIGDFGSDSHVTSVDGELFETGIFGTILHFSRYGGDSECFVTIRTNDEVEAEFDVCYIKPIPPNF